MKFCQVRKSKLDSHMKLWLLIPRKYTWKQITFNSDYLIPNEVFHNYFCEINLLIPRLKIKEIEDK